MISNRCFFHGEELASEAAYLTCLECGHTYGFAQDLEDAYNTKAEQLGAYRKAHDDITFCPLCMHDL